MLATEACSSLLRGRYLLHYSLERCRESVASFSSYSSAKSLYIATLLQLRAEYLNLYVSRKT